MRDSIRKEYFEWLFDIVCARRYSKRISYRKLLTHLHEVEFIYILPMDRNRATDGMDLRHRFTVNHGYDHIYKTILDILDGPCSVLEMLVALSIKCEENIMDDPAYGDRTGQWFWEMIINLGLGGTLDDRFDARIVDEILNRFMNRRYEPNGEGGLFTIDNAGADLRDVEIWFQLCWYLDNIC